MSPPVLNVPFSFSFKDCNIRGGAKNGIHFTYSSEGRPSGECFVELVSLEDMEK